MLTRRSVSCADVQAEVQKRVQDADENKCYESVSGGDSAAGENPGLLPWAGRLEQGFPGAPGVKWALPSPRLTFTL